MNTQFGGIQDLHGKEVNVLFTTDVISKNSNEQIGVDVDQVDTWQLLGSDTFGIYVTPTNSAYANARLFFPWTIIAAVALAVDQNLARAAS